MQFFKKTLSIRVLILAGNTVGHKLMYFLNKNQVVIVYNSTNKIIYGNYPKLNFVLYCVMINQVSNE